MMPNDETISEESLIDSGLSCVSINCSGNQMGFACYHELSNTIYADGLQVSGADMECILNQLKLTLEPNLFLLPQRVTTNQPLFELILAGVDGSPEKYSYKLMKSSNFNENVAFDIMSTKLFIRGANGKDAPRVLNSNIYSGDSQNKYLRLNGYIDMSNNIMCQSLSALLIHLQATVCKLDGGVIEVLAIKPLQINQYMWLDNSCLESLQIIKEDIHPNIVKGTGKSKEGFSLLALMDRTQSIIGKQRLREWMLKPFCNKSLILDRQRGVSLVVKPSNLEFIASICRLLKRVHDMPRVFLRIKKVSARPLEWHKILMTLEAGLPIVDALEGFLKDPLRDSEDKRYIEDLLGLCTTQVARQVLIRLQNVIDFDASRDMNVLIVREGFDAHLDNLRETFDRLEGVLTEAAHKILDQVPLLSKVSVEYIPQVGYLAAIRSDEQQFLPPDKFQFVYSDTTTAVHPSDSRSQSFPGRDGEDPFRDDGHTVYFKCDIVWDLDDAIGDVKADIMDRQKLLIVALEEELLEAEVHLHQLSSVLSTLDAIISLGTIAREGNYTCPDIREEDNVIAIKGGRHPLQELSVDRFVPNDSFISSQQNIALITGPNGSGKSVYLKQIGILVYLAHIGSWLPCEKAIIGLTDHIFTRINSVESSATPQSAFALDLGQISRMLKTCSERSLCLIDEFGKGTNPLDGIALLAATVKYCAHLPTKAMFVLHFTEILHEDVLEADVRARLTTFCMETYQPLDRNDGRSMEEDDDLGESTTTASRRDYNYRDIDLEEHLVEPTPLFKLQVGVCQSSEGIACAKVAGVPEEVLNRAMQAKTCIVKGTPLSHIGPTNRTGTGTLPDDTIHRDQPIHNTLNIDNQDLRLLELFLSRTDDWNMATVEELQAVRDLLSC